MPVKKVLGDLMLNEAVELLVKKQPSDQKEALGLLGSVGLTGSGKWYSDVMAAFNKKTGNKLNSTPLSKIGLDKHLRNAPVKQIILSSIDDFKSDYKKAINAPNIHFKSVCAADVLKKFIKTHKYDPQLVKSGQNPSQKCLLSLATSLNDDALKKKLTDLFKEKSEILAKSGNFQSPQSKGIDNKIVKLRIASETKRLDQIKAELANAIKPFNTSLSQAKSRTGGYVKKMKDTVSHAAERSVNAGLEVQGVNISKTFGSPVDTSGNIISRTSKNDRAVTMMDIVDSVRLSIPSVYLHVKSPVTNEHFKIRFSDHESPNSKASNLGADIILPQFGSDDVDLTAFGEFIKDQMNESFAFDPTSSLSDLQKTTDGHLALYKQDGEGNFAEANNYEIRDIAHRKLASQFINGKPLASPQDAAEYLVHELAGSGREVFAVLWFDEKRCCVGYEQLFSGTFNRSSVYPREVVKSGLSHKAAECIVFHNHPSGHSEPSMADVVLTGRLKDALGMAGISLTDHVVVAGRDFTSLYDRNLF